MTYSELPDDLETALRAVSHAREVREFHARNSKRGSKQREDDIAMAQDRITAAMRPLRSYLGRAPYGAQTRAIEIITTKVRDASQALQSERRKLWKMSTRRKESTKP